MNKSFVLLLFLSVTFSLLHAQGGSLDATFGTAGVVNTSFLNAPSDCRAMALQTNGKVVLAGTYTLGGFGNMAFARYNTNGTLDAGFGTAGTAVINFTSAVSVSSVAVLGDGKILACGSSNSLPTLARLTAAGAADASFGTNGVITFDNDVISILDMRVLGNGKIVGCGLADQGSGKLFTVFRRNADGSADGTFGTNGFTYTDIGNLETLTRMALQTDGKILVTGTVYTNSSTQYDMVLVRYNANGSLDASFGTAGIANVTLAAGAAYEQGNCVAVQSDGKIVVGGRIANAGPTVFAIVRFNSNGTKDTGYGTNGVVTTNFNGIIDEPKAIALQSDGKAVVVGVSNLAGGVTAIAMARYTTAGALDNTFGTGGKVTTNIGNKSQGEAIVIQSDNKILVAGYATVNSLRQFAVCRYGAGTVGIAPIDVSIDNISLFPNPVMDARPNIFISLSDNARYDCTVSTIDGRVISRWSTGELSTGAHYIQVPFPADVSPGLYLVSLKNGASVTTLKLQVGQ
ncbi:MAG: T9SS type A sorting domain-containing protein [Lewinellaceae bacterium]|nr:T9SS type A sorting domain-containing protein [Lewinellaceae bacterium]